MFELSIEGKFIRYVESKYLTKVCQHIAAKYKKPVTIEVLK